MTHYTYHGISLHHEVTLVKRIPSFTLEKKYNRRNINHIMSERRVFLDMLMRVLLFNALITCAFASMLNTTIQEIDEPKLNTTIYHTCDESKCSLDTIIGNEMCLFS